MGQSVKKIAVIITRGGWNNLLQACEWIALAAASGMEVSGYFRDEAAGRMTKSKITELTMSPDYRGREAFVRDLLRQENKADLSKMMQTAKETGNVKFSVCKDSMRYFDVRVEELIPELDEVQTAEAFWIEAVLPADRVLTF
jgi:peroxiredoxin family protein